METKLESKQACMHAIITLQAVEDSFFLSLSLLLDDRAENFSWQPCVVRSFFLSVCLSVFLSVFLSPLGDVIYVHAFALSLAFNLKIERVSHSGNSIFSWLSCCCCCSPAICSSSSSAAAAAAANDGSGIISHISRSRPEESRGSTYPENKISSSQFSSFK